MTKLVGARRLGLVVVLASLIVTVGCHTPKRIFVARPQNIPGLQTSLELRHAVSREIVSLHIGTVVQFRGVDGAGKAVRYDGALAGLFPKEREIVVADEVGGLLRVPVDGVTGLRVAGASKVIPGVLAGMLAGGLGGFLLALVGASSSGWGGAGAAAVGVASAVGGSLVGSGVGALGGYMVSSSKTYRLDDEHWGVVVPEQPGGDG